MILTAGDGEGTAAGRSYRRSEYSVFLRDLESGRIRRILKGHSGVVYSQTFSSDGREVLTASGDGTARLWDVLNGRQLARYRGHKGRLHPQTFLLAAGGF